MNVMLVESACEMYNGAQRECNGVYVHRGNFFGLHWWCGGGGWKEGGGGC